MSNIESSYGVMQEERVTRAILEMADWTWRWDGEAWVVTTPGGTYRVWVNSCQCADFQRRCSGSECVCKHAVALRIRLIEGMSPGRPIPAQRAPEALSSTRKPALTLEEEDALFDRIFG